MSCYLRHIEYMLEEAGITVTPANRRLVDEAIHKIMNTRYKNCPATWTKIKQDILNYPDRRRAFVKQLRSLLGHK